MKSMLSQVIALAAVLAVSNAAAASNYQGCYSSSGSMQPQRTDTFQTMETCLEHACGPMGKAVLATTHGDGCWCGDSLPAKAYLVDDSKCDMACPGYALEKCGGATTFSVYLTGEGDVEDSPLNTVTSSSAKSSPAPSSTQPPSSSSSSSSSVTSPNSVVSSSHQTSSASSTAPSGVTSSNQTASSTTTNTASTAEPTSGSNKAAIPVGVIASFIAFAAAGAVFL